MAVTTLEGNLARVREEIASVQAQEGVRQVVRIVAVTKGHPPIVAREAVSAGIHDLGENRVQEAVTKLEELRDLSATWHLIGHLQTNKAKYVPGRFGWVHSVDSVRVVDALERALERNGEGVPLQVLIQVNVAGEGQKTGCDPEEAAQVVARVEGASHLEVSGLMTMAPYTSDEHVQRDVFAGLRRLRERLESSGSRLPELSMGMSGDYRQAVAEGATMLRLGTVLFGERPS
ncbi:MAG: YggS family pyridoxal phosphate-dependent enzyme [Gemmatimonadota bacterium]|nr:YggS family pyridoxal phosphate-dependent enzyme [Gemmatimonadota bacterium]